MKKHDADASYQFSCSICGKKFEKKDSVVAHKAKSHPEVLIAEALAANAGALITTPGALLEASTGPLRTEQMQQMQVGAVPVSQVGSLAQVGHVGPVVVVDPDHSLHNIQVPVTLALPTTEEVLGSGTTSSHPTSTHSLQALPLHFVSTAVSQQQQPQVQQLPLQATAVTQQAALVQPLPAQPYSSQPQILHMTFRAVPPHQQQIQQLPLLSVAQQIPQQSQALARAPNPNPSPAPGGPVLTQNLPVTSDCRGTLHSFSTEPPPPSSSASSLPQSPPIATREARQGGAVWEGNGPGENGNVGGVWEAGGDGQERVMTDTSDGQIRHGLM